MYKIDKTPFGFTLTFSGTIDNNEMLKWMMESNKLLLPIAGKKFNCLIHMEELKPLSQDAKATLIKGQALYRRIGMQKSAVIVPTQLVAMQMKNAAKESGIADTEKYFTLEQKNDAIKWINQ